MVIHPPQGKSKVPIGTTLSETGALGEAVAVPVATRGKTMAARAAMRPVVIDRVLDIVATPVLMALDLPVLSAV